MASSHSGTTATGRAAVFVKSNLPFELRDYPVPSPREGEALIQVLQANICGSDRHLWTGSTELGQLGIRHNVILGHEMVGRIVALSNARRKDASGKPLTEGDRVTVAYHAGCGSCRACDRNLTHHCATAQHTPLTDCGVAPHFFGAFADYYVVRPGQALYKVPDRMPARVASLANCAMAQVVHAADVGKVGPNDFVVVVGCGGVGLLACALARMRSAASIIAIDVEPARLAMARRMGATHVIDATLEEPDAQVGLVRKLTGGWGADCVIEAAGLPEVLPHAVRCLGRGGRLVTLGAVNPRAYWRADAAQLVRFNRSIKGVSLYPQHALERGVELLMEMAQRFPVEQLVSHEYPLSRITDAMREPPPGLIRAAVVPRMMTSTLAAVAPVEEVAAQATSDP